MADTGWLLVGTGASGGTGAAWLNSGNITADDDAVATHAFSDGATSAELRGTNISAGIPADSTIDGVEVRVQANEATVSSNGTISSVGLFFGSALGTAKTPATALTTTLTNYDFGGPVDTWGAILNDTNVNDIGFGAYVKTSLDAGAARVDAMWVKVYYTPAITPVESDRAISYAINTTVTSDRTIEYAVAEIGTVTSDRQILYAIDENESTTSDWLIVGTGTAGGTGEAWSNPENITASDNNRALVSVTGGESQELRGTNPNPGLSSSAVLNGVAVRVEAVGDSDTISQVGLLSNGVTIGTIKNPAQATTAADALYEFGGLADTWGATLTSAIVNDPSFGAYVKMDGAGTVGVDAVWLRFTYTVPESFIPAPPRPVQPEFSLAFYTPVGSGLSRRRTDLVAIDPSVTALSWTTQLEGFGQLNVGLDARHEPGSWLRYLYPAELPVDLPPFAEVQLTDGGSGAVLFEGRLEEFSRIGGVVRAISATGYGLTATRDGYLADDDDTLTTNGEILRRALNAIPALRTAGDVDFTDPQIATSYRLLGAIMVADLVSQVMSTGNALGQQMDFAVWEGRVAELKGRARPHLPHYRVDEDETVQVALSYANVYSAVNVKFQTSNEGDATVTSGNTSVTVTHGLGVVPRLDQITVNATSGIGEEREITTGTGTMATTVGSVTINHLIGALPDIVRFTPTTDDQLFEIIANRTSTSFDVQRSDSAGEANFEWEAEAILGLPSTYSVTNITATTFDITLDFAALADGATFTWSVNVDDALTGETSLEIADRPRRAILIPGGTLNYELAVSYRDAMLKMLAGPEYRVTINRHVSNWLAGPRGEPVPPWLVRAGQWVQVGDLPMQIILRTTYDPFSETFSLEAGAPQRDLGTLLSSMQRTVERLAAARNANTGAKL